MAGWDDIAAFNQPFDPLGGGHSLAQVGSVNQPLQTGLFGGGGALGTGLSGLQLFNAGMGGLQTIGGLIGSLGSLSLARKSFNLQKDALNTNLTNQIQAYNTALEDRARSRAVVEGQSDQERDAYIAANKATRSGG